MSDKKCSACEKLNPLSSHRCFIFGTGRLVNVKPLRIPLSERLFRRLLIEFPELADEMRASEVRPSRIYSRGSWNWSYWPVAHIHIGSAWTMAECVKAKKWEILELPGQFDTDIILPPASSPDL